MILNSDIKDRLKKFLLFFRQAKIVFVIACFLDYFTLEHVPSVNSIWIISPASLFHAWVTKFQTIFIFFKLSILTSNNVIWVNFSAIVFSEAQQFVKISTTGYVPVFYEAINLFIKPQSFLLMGLCLIVTVCDGLLILFLHFVCELLPNPWKQHVKTMLSEVLYLWFLT